MGKKPREFQKSRLNIVSKKELFILLLWKSVENKRIKYNRNCYEDQLLSCLKEILSADVKVDFLADRGFSDHKFIKFLSEELKFDDIIRIKLNTKIISKETSLKASDYLNKEKVTLIKK